MNSVSAWVFQQNNLHLVSIEIAHNEDPIFVNYKAFEKGRISEMAELFQDLAAGLLTLKSLQRPKCDLVGNSHKY